MTRSIVLALGLLATVGSALAQQEIPGGLSARELDNLRASVLHRPGGCLNCIPGGYLPGTPGPGTPTRVPGPVIPIPNQTLTQEQPFSPPDTLAQQVAAQKQVIIDLHDEIETLNKRVSALESRLSSAPR